jgi:hypothetical protein
MRIPIAILIAGALIAGAILLLFRWEISGANDIGFYKLDRWTGRTFTCNAVACYEIAR